MKDPQSAVWGFVGGVGLGVWEAGTFGDWETGVLGCWDTGRLGVRALEHWGIGNRLALCLRLITDIHVGFPIQ